MKVKKKKHLPLLFGVLLAGMILYALILGYMLFWGVTSSFKGRLEFADNILGLPRAWVFENYYYALRNFVSPVGMRNVYLDEMLLYSLLYAGGCAFVSTACCCMMGYATSKFKYKLNKVIYGFVLIAMILPLVGSLPSQIVVFRTLNLYDTMIGMWVAKFNFISVYFMVFHAIFKGLPVSYSEAAKIDGAGNWRIFLSIMLPLVKVTFVTVFLLFFVSYWNDYSTPLLMMKSYPTIALGLYYFRFRQTPDTSPRPVQLAGAIMVFIPILLLFIAFRKKLMGNISLGGLKE